MSSPAPLPIEIHRSAQRGELQKVVKWLHKGGPVGALCSTKSVDGRATTATLLHAAAGYDQLEMVRELLKRGASVDLPSSLGYMIRSFVEERAVTAVPPPLPIA